MKGVLIRMKGAHKDERNPIRMKGAPIRKMYTLLKLMKKIVGILK